MTTAANYCHDDRRSECGDWKIRSTSENEQSQIEIGRGSPTVAEEMNTTEVSLTEESVACCRRSSPRWSSCN
ncbi:hypothetical protein Bca4012_057504 [Brassica carinata]